MARPLASCQERPAIALGSFGRGRVVCFSPHPEKTPGYESLVLRGIHWAANEVQAEAIANIGRRFAPLL